MSLRCFVENCPNELKLYCSCKTGYVFSCIPHLGQHIDEGDVTQHNIKVVYQKYNSEKKQLLINAYGKAIESVTKTHSLIMQIVSSTIQELTKIKEATEFFFRSQSEEIQLLIENLIKQDSEIVVPELIKTNKFIYEEFIYHNTSLIENLDSFCQTVINFSKGFPKFYKGLHEFNVDEILDFEGNANMNKNLYFFRIGTKNLIKFDVNSFSPSEIQVNLNENQGSIGARCQLPGNKFFHYGGYNPCNCTGYIIDLMDYSILSIPSIRVVNHASATYFEKEVYIFGGYNNGGDINCDRFNLDTKTWSKIANFPDSSAAYSISALPCREFIILSGSTGNKLYKYNIKANTYDILTTTVTNNNHNILFRDKGIYYYLSSITCFKSKEGNLEVWAKNNKNLSQAIIHTNSKPVTRNRSVFFESTYQSIIYKFDLVTEEIFRILEY